MCSHNSSIQFRAAASRPIAVVPMTVFELHWGSAGDPNRTLATPMLRIQKSYCRTYVFDSLNATNLGLIVVLIILSACSDTSDHRISRIENGLLPITANTDDLGKKASIAQRMDHYGVPGVSVAVFDSGEVIWARGYGVASTEANIPVDDTTLFQAASISKPVAACWNLMMSKI